MSLVGTKVRNFDIVAMLGQGGMGEVYVAFDENLQRKVALKAIRPGRGLTPTARARFLREARILSSLDHPGICRIYDYLEIEGREYLALELIEGRTLFRSFGELDTSAKLDIAEQITRVLATAHEENIVHRDLKPDNVMLTRDGRIKILDFGLARNIDDAAFSDEEAVPGDAAGSGDFDRTVAVATPAWGGGLGSPTLPGSILGTPLFMSPEQAAGEPVSPASDMYSLGLVLQWLFTGKTAYEEQDDLESLLRQVVEARTLPVLGTDPDLGRLIERLKSRSAARRPTALETLDRISWLRRKPARRNRRLLIAGIVLTLAAAGLKYTLDLRRERSVAENNRFQAEGLIEFMLGDLRDKLTPVGRLDVLDDVGAKALEYYSARRQGDLTDDEYFRLAKAMMQIGEVRMAQGDLESAREAFDETMAATSDLLTRNPSETSWLAQSGAAHFWIGNVDYSLGDNAAADRHFLRYLEIADELVSLEPDNPDWQLEVGYALTNLAALRDETGDRREALEYLDRSIEIKRELSTRFPDDREMRSSLANSLSWAGRSRMDRGDLSLGLELFRDAAGIRHQLEALDPDDTINLLDLANLHHLIATTLELLGREDEALDHYRRDLALTGGLVEHDPENYDWKASLVFSHNSLGLFWLRQGSPESARNRLAAAKELLDDLLEVNPANDSWRLQEGTLAANQARLAKAEENRSEAMATLDAAVPRARDLFASGGEPDEAYALADLLIERGFLYRAQGRQDFADGDFDEAVRILEPLAAAATNCKTLFAWARVLAAKGRTDEVATVVTRLDESGFARRDYLEFRRKAGP